MIKSTSLCLSISSVWKFVIKNEISYPLIGFLLKMTKLSALCCKNRVNLWTRMCSISSACLILILIRTLLMLGSINTLSFSLRDTVSGFRITSGDDAASISGTLCRSEACEAKFESEMAAVREVRTHCRYGRRDCDCGRQYSI